MPTTWKPLVYTGLLLATKYWEDRYFWNIDAVNATGVFELEEVNRFEHLIETYANEPYHSDLFFPYDQNSIHYKVLKFFDD